MGPPLSQQLIWKERELAGERALRQGWEDECRRLLEQNAKLRQVVVLLARRIDSTRSAGRP
jgi:hypothetical protein